MKASFANPCECCEIRLLIKWDTTWHNANGTPHDGFKPPDDVPDKWHEDRNEDGIRRGHRKEPPGLDNDWYRTFWNYDDREKGCYYVGVDQPIFGGKGIVLTGKFDFKLEVVDVCAGDPPPVVSTSNVLTIDWSAQAVPCKLSK